MPTTPPVNPARATLAAPCGGVSAAGRLEVPLAPLSHRARREQAATAKGGPDWRGLVENAATGIGRLNADGLLVYANPALCRDLQLEPFAPTGLEELVPANDWEVLRLHLNRVLRGEAPRYRGEHRFLRGDEPPFWAVLDLGRDTPGTPDEFPGLVLQLTDIDRRRRAEAAMERSERRWKHALDAARQGVWEFDHRDDGSFFSSTWRAMRGIPADADLEWDRQAWLQFVHPADREKVAGDVERQGNGEDGYDMIEYRERRRDNGKYMWILSRGRPVEWDESGKRALSIGIDTDITHLKEVEADLAAERERWRVALESIGDGTICCDAFGRIIFLNSAAEVLTGWSGKDAIGQPVDKVLDLRRHIVGEPTPVALVDSIIQGQPLLLEDDGVLMSRAGRRLDIRCSVSPVRVADGTLEGAVLVFQDVSQSRALQRRLAYSAHHDDLTGLPNRAAFEKTLDEAIASTRAQGLEHALLYVDLDRFKPVNDTAGHAAGDALLQEVAQVLRRACRGQDISARMGGDEFTLLLYGCSAQQGREAGEAIAAAIAGLQFYWRGKSYAIGASVGITAITPAGPSGLGYIGEADAACYAAKKAGRGRAVTFGEMPAKVRR